MAKNGHPQSLSEACGAVATVRDVELRGSHNFVSLCLDELFIWLTRWSAWKFRHSIVHVHKDRQ